MDPQCKTQPPTVPPPTFKKVQPTLAPANIKQLQPRLPPLSLKQRVIKDPYYNIRYGTIMQWKALKDIDRHIGKSTPSIHGIDLKSLVEHLIATGHYDAVCRFIPVSRYGLAAAMFYRMVNPSLYRFAVAQKLKSVGANPKMVTVSNVKIIAINVGETYGDVSVLWIDEQKKDDGFAITTVSMDGIRLGQFPVCRGTATDIETTSCAFTTVAHQKRDYFLVAFVTDRFDEITLSLYSPTGTRMQKLWFRARDFRFIRVILTLHKDMLYVAGVSNFDRGEKPMLNTWKVQIVESGESIEIVELKKYALSLPVQAAEYVSNSDSDSDEDDNEDDEDDEDDDEDDEDDDEEEDDDPNHSGGWNLGALDIDTSSDSDSSEDEAENTEMSTGEPASLVPLLRTPVFNYGVVAYSTPAILMGKRQMLKHFFTIPKAMMVKPPAFWRSTKDKYVSIVAWWHLYPPHLFVNPENGRLSLGVPTSQSIINPLMEGGGGVGVKIYEWDLETSVEGTTEAEYVNLVENATAIATHSKLNRVVAVNTSTSFHSLCLPLRNFAYGGILSIGGGGDISAVMVDRNTISISNLQLRPM